MVIEMNEELKELIINNQNLIYSIASKFKGDKEDLFQAGCLGLIDAYQKYDSNYNTKFTTYAYPFIMGEMYKYVLVDKNIKLSPEIVKLNLAIKKAEDYLTQKFKRGPTDIELSSFLEIPVYKLVETRNCYQTLSSDDVSKDDLILLRDALNKLEAKEKELIIKRYFYNKTQQEVANELGINQVKVSREEGKVLTKLKKYM